MAAFDAEPDAFVYSLAQNYQGTKYVRLANLAEVKAHLRAGLPCAFGFSCYSGMERVGRDGLIPFPQPGERFEGGHAVMAAGYDDVRGAVLIRNSWGTGWGENGYGWLPYRYFEAGLCRDFWVLLRQEWLDLGDFD